MLVPSRANAEPRNYKKNYKNYKKTILAEAKG
jgi:hypothetical protein